MSTSTRKSPRTSTSKSLWPITPHKTGIKRENSNGNATESSNTSARKTVQFLPTNDSNKKTSDDSDSSKFDEEFKNRYSSELSLYASFIPSYISGSRALSSGSWETIFGVGWVVYFIYVFYLVFGKLNHLYIEKNSVEEGIKDLSATELFFIVISYSVVDLVYIWAFIQLYFFYKSEIISTEEKKLIKEGGIEAFKDVEKKIVSSYRWGIVINVVVYVIVIFVWLSTIPYEFTACFFWAVTFGFFHALHPNLLSCSIAHPIYVLHARVEIFKSDIFHHTTYDDPEDLWDTFQNCRKEAKLLGDKLQWYIKWFVIYLILAISLQSMAVIQFKGSMFMLVYMSHNLWNLMNTMYQAQSITSHFEEFCEDLIHLPSQSIMGKIGSPVRKGFLMALQRDATYPSIEMFGLSLSKANFWNIVIFGVGSIANFLWQQVEKDGAKGTSPKE